MTKGRFWGNKAPNVSKEDMERIDRRHPERSFTGGDDAARFAAAPTPSAPSPSASATATSDDLVTQLERLRTLHAEGVLTDEEFAAAKARLLLGRD
ncbi:MAG: SHOCT domain-containing protein [Actinobacteria bacterium]|nr:SHOCT domain-containing protein [Actinomycetota bacterium]